MKTIVLVRHAKSSWKDQDQEDHERPLNHRGERDAAYMAKIFSEKKIIPQLLASSTAARALATAYALAKALKIEKEKVLRVSELYLAEPQELMNYASLLDDDYSSAMLVGHNPGITTFANSLGDINIDNVPTCGILCFQFGIDRWNELETREGTLTFFLYPKMYFKDSDG